MLSTIFSYFSSNAFLIGLGGLLVAAGLFYGYFRYSQDQIATLEANIATARAALAVQQQTIDDIQALAANQKVSIETMQGRLSQAETDRAQLAAAIRALNIIQRAQTNRPLLEKNLNQQLNSLFQDITGPHHEPKSP